MDLEVVGRFFWGLIPQKDDDAVKLWEWRWKSVFLGVATMGGVLYLGDWIPFVTTPLAKAETVRVAGVATDGKIDALSGQVQDLKGKVVAVLSQQKDAQIHQVTNDLIDARRYQCRAINSADGSARPFWNGRIASLKLQYQQLTGDSWSEQDCNSF